MVANIAVDATGTGTAVAPDALSPNLRAHAVWSAEYKGCQRLSLGKQYTAPRMKKARRGHFLKNSNL
jgi:hypothetical protein